MSKFSLKVIEQIHKSTPEGTFVFDMPGHPLYAGPRFNQVVLERNTKGTDAEFFYKKYLKIVDDIKKFREEYHEIYSRELEKEASARVVRLG